MLLVRQPSTHGCRRDNNHRPADLYSVTMKILVLAPQPFFRDSRESIALRTFLATLVADGHRPTCMIFPQGEDPGLKGCRLLSARRIPLPGLNWKKPFYRRAMAAMSRRLLAREKFALIVGFAGATGLARRLGKQFNIPHLLYLDHLQFDHELGRSLLPLFSTWNKKRAIKASCGVLVADHALEAKVTQLCPTALVQRLEQISLFHAPARSPRTRKNDLRTRRKWKTLMYVGDLGPEDGIELLIDAFSLVYLEQRQTRLVCIGGSRRQATKFRQRADKLGVGPRVRFIPAKPMVDLPAYLEQADLLIFPATGGSIVPHHFPTCLDSSRPVVATSIPLHRQFLDSTTALLVEPVDSQLALAITGLLADELQRTTLFAQAKARVAEEYSQEAYHRKLHSFFARFTQRLRLPN